MAKLISGGRVVSKTGAARSTLAIFDQAVVSGTNFTTAVVIGRLCGAGEFGAYTLSFTLLILLAAANEAVALTPYTVYAPRLSGDRLRRYRGATLLQCFLVALAVSACLALWGGGLAFLDATGLRDAAFMLAVIAPFALLREFARRCSFAHLRTAEATAVDAMTSLVQLTGLAFLWSTDNLSAVSALAAIGVGCGSASLGWLWLRRREFDLRRRSLAAVVAKNLRFGRWMLPARMTAVAQGHSLPWLVACLLGLPAAGRFAACSTLIAAFNPVLMGIGSLLAPQTARAYSHGGAAELRGVVWRTTLWVVLATAGFAVLIAVFGGQLLTLAFGAEYASLGGLVALLAFALLASILGMGADNGLRAIERPDAGFAASLTGLVLGTVVAFLLIPVWGLIGAAAGLLAGALGSSAVYCVAFTRISRSLS